MNGGGGRARRLTRRLAARNGTSRPLHVRRPESVPLRGDRFTTAARMRWLNAASTRIGTTLDLERTAEELAAFSVPRLADAAVHRADLHSRPGERIARHVGGCWAAPAGLSC